MSDTVPAIKPVQVCSGIAVWQHVLKQALVNTSNVHGNSVNKTYDVCRADRKSCLS